MLVGQVIDYLNQVTGSKYRASTDATKKHIRARIRDGYGFDDFKKVIDTKSKQWMGGDMAKFLRPDTLFGPKFESYLNEPTGNSPPRANSFTDYTHQTNYDWDAIEAFETANPVLKNYYGS